MSLLHALLMLVVMPMEYSSATDDHGGNKRKFGDISPDGSTFLFHNKLADPPSDGYNEAHYSPDTENGPASKKSRVTPSSPAVCTPTITKEKCPFPSETSSPETPSPLTITTGESTAGPPSSIHSERKFGPHSSATPSSDKNHSSDSRKEGDDHDESHQEDLNIARKLLFVDETTEEIFGCLQRVQAQQKLVERLKQLAEVGPKYEIDLKMADLLEKLSSSNPQLQNVAKKAREASMQLQNGVKLMTPVRELLRAAFTDVPTSAE